MLLAKARVVVTFKMLFGQSYLRSTPPVSHLAVLFLLHCEIFPFTHFHARFSSRDGRGAAATGLEIPHDQQQFHVILLAPGFAMPSCVKIWGSFVILVMAPVCLWSTMTFKPSVTRNNLRYSGTVESCASLYQTLPHQAETNTNGNELATKGICSNHS